MSRRRTVHTESDRSRRCEYTDWSLAPSSKKVSCRALWVRKTSTTRLSRLACLTRKPRTRSAIKPCNSLSRRITPSNLAASSAKMKPPKTQIMSTRRRTNSIPMSNSMRLWRVTTRSTICSLKSIMREIRRKIFRRGSSWFNRRSSAKNGQLIITIGWFRSLRFPSGFSSRSTQSLRMSSLNMAWANVSALRSLTKSSSLISSGSSASRQAATPSKN